MYSSDWPTHEQLILPLQIETVKEIYDLVRDSFQNFWPEPLEEFESRYPGRLESIINQPFQEIGGTVLYPPVLRRATAIFYLFTKGHAFKNGNKRMGLMMLLFYLNVNRLWLKTSKDVLYDFALLVAKSSPDEKDEMFNEIEKFLCKNVERENPLTALLKS